MFTHLGVVKGRLGGRGFYYKARWLDEADYELAAHTKLLGTSRQEQLAERAIDLIRVGEQQDTQAIREALGVEPQSAEDRALRRGLDKRAVTDRAKITTNHPLLLVNDGEAGGKGGGGTSRVYERVR